MLGMQKKVFVNFVPPKFKIVNFSYKNSKKSYMCAEPGMRNLKNCCADFHEIQYVGVSRLLVVHHVFHFSNHTVKFKMAAIFEFSKF